MKAVKKGNVVIVAVHGKKIYTLKVTVQGKSAVISQPIVKPKEEATTKEEVTTKEEATTEGEKAEYATVTFLGFDDEVVCTMEYEKGKPYGKFPKLHREDYLFLGWHMNSDIGKRVRESDVCIGDITLYAKFVMLLPPVEETYEIVEE